MRFDSFLALMENTLTQINNTIATIELVGIIFLL